MQGDATAACCGSAGGWAGGPRWPRQRPHCRGCSWPARRLVTIGLRTRGPKGRLRTRWRGARWRVVCAPHAEPLSAWRQRSWRRGRLCGSASRCCCGRGRGCLGDSVPQRLAAAADEAGGATATRCCSDSMLLRARQGAPQRLGAGDGRAGCCTRGVPIDLRASHWRGWRSLGVLPYYRLAGAGWDPGAPWAWGRFSDLGPRRAPPNLRPLYTYICTYLGEFSYLAV